jgi:hypothetical protein
VALALKDSLLLGADDSFWSFGKRRFIAATVHCHQDIIMYFPNIGTTSNMLHSATMLSSSYPMRIRAECHDRLSFALAAYLENEMIDAGRSSHF